MMFSHELIKTICGNYIPGNKNGIKLDEWIYNELTRINGIRLRLDSYNQQIEKIEEKCVMDIAKIRHEMNNIKKECKHEIKDDDSDTASSCTCQICGAVV